MYDENLGILETADYKADTFWLEEGYYDDFTLDIDEEMDLVSIERASSLIEELVSQYDSISMTSEKLEDAFIKMRDAANNAAKSIQHFINTYEKLKEMEF